jgi:ABC-2 type transport system ATP-binding protein
VVFLDEPMSGLDPLGRREVRDVIEMLRARKVTVFFSSHILPDVEALCDRVAILNRGKLREVGALDAILNVQIEGHEIILGRITSELHAQLHALCDRITPLGDRLHLRAGNPRQVETIVSTAVSGGAELVSVNPIRRSLEDYFFSEVQA